MTNFDKYKNKIEEFNGAFAVNVHTLEAQPCNGYDCGDCLFRPSDPFAPTLRCTDKLIKWLCEECKEPLKPTLETDGYADGELVYDIWHCPGCDTAYEVETEKYNYCPNCGQAIDWSEE